MTATIILIRHAVHSQLGHVLSGRTERAELSDLGRAQAERLARRLEAESIDALHTSPALRTRETAAAIAAGRSGLGVETVAALDEIDFGEWSGREFAELADDPGWRHWNEARASATAPQGESMAEARDRAWRHIARTAAASPRGVVAVVTHCDIIRAVVAHVLGLSLDHLLRFDIDPASASRLAVGAWGAKLLSLNERCDG